MAEAEARSSVSEDRRAAGPSEREKPQEGRSSGRVWLFRGLGLVLAGLVWLALGTAEGLEPAGRIVAAIGILMATWWMTEALPLSATALLPIVLFPAFMVE